MRPEFVALGEPMLEFNQAPQGADGRAYFLEGFGGDTSNATIAAARQGVRTAYMTALGDDWPGARLMALWRAAGVDVSAVKHDPTRQTAVYFVTHGDGRHQFLHYRRNSAASAFGPDDLDVRLIANARMLYVSGISQGISEAGRDAVLRAIDIARGHNVQIAYDTNYRPKLWSPAEAASVMHAAFAQVDIALPSLDDAATLTGLTDPDAIADFYLRLGPRIVVVKNGAAGALLATPDTRVHIPPFPCNPVDATGAGDTFCGSFLARIILGDAPVPAARYAACATALKCEGFGAVAPIPTSSQVLHAMESK
ncbi:MAG: sugar kinase [Acetobacteraceae bacterium]|nr:sugar kinase [Acetobacteraceae bacterium]